MSRRTTAAASAQSLDSFLDIVSNVVGVLVLVALVTVLGAGEIAVSSGASSMRGSGPGTARRVIVECRGDRVLVLDEEGNARRVAEAARGLATPVTADALTTLLRDLDVGDAAHRVAAEPVPGGLAWVYTARSTAPGETADDLGRPGSRLRASLRGLEPDGFAYFVVHDDGFDVFRRAREIAAAEGIPVGWHPVEGDGPVRLSAVGSLGRHVR